jgi:hypothetical protein
VTVIHCFSFGQYQAVLCRVAEALWGIVLHCALQLPPLSTASFLQLELEVSVLGKCLVAVDTEFTCVHVLPLSSPLAHHFLHLQVGYQAASAGGFASAMCSTCIQRTGAVLQPRVMSIFAVCSECPNLAELCSSFVCLTALFCSFHLKNPSFATFCTAARV